VSKNPLPFTLLAGTTIGEVKDLIHDKVRLVFITNF
jgi:hypothetical protein